MRDFIDMVVIPIVALVLIMSGIVFGVVQMDKHDCGVYAKTTGRSTQYQFVTCYVDTGNGFVPKEEFNMRAITNEPKVKP
ncbi:hypothetical protein [Serratia fonticola]